MELPSDKNDYTRRRKKRGKGTYKSGPYADLKLPPPNKGNFEFKLPDNQEDKPPELFHKQTTFWALKRQKWFCAHCGMLLRYSDMSNWTGPIAEFKRDPKDNENVIGLCPECFKK